MAEKNYYRILQIDPSADPEVIAAAYKRLSMKYHPDTNRSPDANQRMQEINEAYRVLSDPDQRARYDDILSRRAWPGSGYGDWRTTQSGNGRQQAPRSYSPAEQSSQNKLAEMISALAFPMSYVIIIFVIFRLIRPPGLLPTLAIIIIAGVIAYYVSVRVNQFFRRG
ncbi:MAG: J domain-containing protein [Anaerolineales bacterium]